MFQKHFYHETIKRTVSVFGTLFNNISIIRKDNSGRVLNQQRVPLAYGPKDKYLTRIEQQSSLTDSKIAIKLPRMSFEITSLVYDNATKMQKGHREVMTNFDYHNINNRNNLLGPVFYKMGIQLNIITKTQDDALQILEQILPFFQPQYTVTVKEVTNEFLSDYPFTLSSVSMADEYEGDYEVRRAIIYTLEFETKVRFYGPIEEKAIIKKATVHTGIAENEEFESKSIAIVNPFISKPDEQYTIVQKVFGMDHPLWVSVDVADTTKLEVGNYIVGLSNGTTGYVAAINGQTLDVINIDGTFEAGENFVSLDKKTFFEITSVNERWVPYGQ